MGIKVREVVQCKMELETCENGVDYYYCSNGSFSHHYFLHFISLHMQYTRKRKAKMDFTGQRHKNEENGILDYFFLEYANAYILLKCHVTYLLIDKVGQFHSCYKEKVQHKALIVYACYGKQPPIIFLQSSTACYF